MPELPEVETIAADVRPHLEGRTITAVRVFKPDILKKTSRATFQRAVAGRRVTRVWRRAKNLVLDLDDGRRVVIQPGMTGSFQVSGVGCRVSKTPKPGTRNPAPDTRHPKPGTRNPAPGTRHPTPDPYDVIHFTLDNGAIARYHDVRRLGRVYLFTPKQWERHDAAIGPEPLDAGFTAEQFLARLKGRRLMIKKAIMDQRVLAGVGNIYASEALWMAGVDPSRQSSRLSAVEAARLHRAIADVLQRSIEGRGTTISDYRTGTGEPGGFQNRLAVYDRAGEPCLRCGRRIALTHAIDARSSYFCPGCQH